jgi:PAS domain-containing protein
MTSNESVTAFLAELADRRERLSGLLERPASREEALAEELAETSEMLLVAEEELRVQQEQLEDARLHAAALERVQGPPPAQDEAAIDTDLDGAVLDVSAAAYRLVGRTNAPIAPRPIATWFHAAARRQIRTLLTEVRRGGAVGETLVLPGEVQLRRANGTTLPVEVSVGRIGDGDRLRWELHATVALPPAQEDSDSAGATALEVLVKMNHIADNLARDQSSNDVLQDIARAAVDIIPGATHAGVTLLKRGGEVETAAATDDVVIACDLAQYELSEGPCLSAIVDGLFCVHDTERELRWPNFAQRAAAVGVRSVVAVQLMTARGPIGALNAYSDKPDAFDEESELIARALATQAAVALARATMEENLRAGLATRETIGQAVGILVERRRITPEQAFEALVRSSQHTHLKLRDLAQLVVDTGEDPAEIERRATPSRHRT